MRRLLRASIWHPQAIPVYEKKYASLKRVWLPLYDAVAMVAGLLAAVFGSRLLDRLYGDATDAIGLFFSLVALACLAGVAFPRLWVVEFVGKTLLVGMIIAYITAIIMSPSPEQLARMEAPSWFIAVMILLPLPLPLFRLDLLMSEWADRRADERRSAREVARD